MQRRVKTNEDVLMKNNVKDIYLEEVRKINKNKPIPFQGICKDCNHFLNEDKSCPHCNECEICKNRIKK